MSRKKYLINTLEACEKFEFDKIVKVYLQEVHDYRRISITDGKDDTGIDIRVFDTNGQKLQYQLTTQKSQSNSEKSKFRNKLEEDIDKAKVNSNNYGYHPSLIFFYSKKLTLKVIRDLENKALQKGINLTIIEANRIADEAEEYIQLQKTIIDTNGIAELSKNNNFFEDDDKNLIFDLVSFGKSSDFRLQILEAFILEKIFTNGELSFDQIKDLCKTKFNDDGNTDFYVKLLARLQTVKKITKNQKKLHYILTKDENDKILSLKAKYQIDERNFIDGILKILNRYQFKDKLKEIVVQLKLIYTSNFNTNLNEVISKVSEYDVSNISRGFTNFIQQNIQDKECTNKLAIELLKHCSDNKFIQKFCASKVFSEKTNLQRIQRYVSTKKKVFLDTQISLYGLCYYYNPHSNIENYFFNISKTLLRIAQKNNIKFFLPDRYLWECTNHVSEALSLVPFTQLPNFSKLGTSKNVFYNFYLFENNRSAKYLSFQDFLEKFNFKVSDNYKAHNRILESHLAKLNIFVEKINSDEYDIDEIVQLMDLEIGERRKFKSKFTLDNDAIIFEFLSDNKVEVHPQNPIFLTWDKSFFNVQSKYFDNHPEAQRWFLLTPSKFIDQFSILQFNIDSDIVTNELIALISDDIVKRTHSLIDNLVLILNPKDEVGLEYTRRFAEMRDKEILRLGEEKIFPPDDLESEAIIDDIFYYLTKHYKEKDQQEFDSFRELFTIEKLMPQVTSLIEKSINNTYKMKRFDSGILKEFDDLVKDIKRK